MLNFLQHAADIGGNWLHVQPPSTFMQSCFEDVALPVRVENRMCSHCFKLQLHNAIYRLRFYSNSLTHILPLSNSHSDVASIQKNRGDKSHRVIVALVNTFVKAVPCTMDVFTMDLCAGVGCTYGACRIFICSPSESKLIFICSLSESKLIFICSPSESG